MHNTRHLLATVLLTLGLSAGALAGDAERAAEIVSGRLPVPLL